MDDERTELVRALRAGVGIVRDARVPPALQPVAYDRVLEALLAPKPRIAKPPEPDGVWRCPRCGGRPQALKADGKPTQYGCARGHPLVAAPEGAKLRA